MIPNGRGAAMQRFLAQLKGEEADQDEGASRPVGKEVPEYGSKISEGMREIAIARPGRGRGLHSTEPSPPQAPLGRGIYHDEPPEPRPGRSTDPSAGAVEPVGGRGRSALMAAFLAQQRSEDSAPGRSVPSEPSYPTPYPRPASRQSPPSRPSYSTTSRPPLLQSPPFGPSYSTPSSRPPLLQSPPSGPSYSTPSSRSPLLQSPPRLSSRSPPQTEFPRHSKQSVEEYEEEKEPVIQRGSQGTPQEVVCNYINLEVEPGKGVFNYDVRFSPPEDNLSMKTRMINQYLDELGGVKSYNGVRLLLSIQLRNEKTFKCDHPAQGTPVTMTLICKGPSRAKDAADVYNMLFRRIMVHLGLKNMGRKFFDPSGAVNIPQHKLEVWPGYVTAVQQYEGGIQLCCDASHRVMRTENVQEVMRGISQMCPDKYKDEILKTLLGSVVLTRYNNLVYRVDDIDWDKNPESKFTDQSGREISFVEYYKSHHDIEIRNRTQPLIVSRVERKRSMNQPGMPKEVRMVCLIPELCYITGLTDAIRNDFRIMRDLTQKLQLTPTQRYDGLCKFLDNVKHNKQSQELLHKWGLRVSNAPVRLEARVLPQETILYGNGSVILPPGNSNWVVNSKLLVAKDIQSWAILFINKDKKVAMDFQREMTSCSAQMGMRVYDAKMIQIADNRNDVFLNTLRGAIQPGLQLVVIFFPSLRSDRYAAVKKVCCIEKPVSSQVIQTKTLSRPDKVRSITKKIAMQINCKLGGALWGLKIPFVKDKLMVCGMDVYHGPAGKNVSVMGFVATSDPLQTTWYSRVGFGTSNQEISDSLRLCMLGALKKYNEGNGVFPDKIIMFRDGLSDGQLAMTSEFEVPQMLQSFKDLSPSYNPSLTVIVCQKRIMARMMAVQGGSGPQLRLGNPGPGSVMDHTITRRDWYDFFLVSQSSSKGTISPTHYIVVHDDGQMKPDHIQRMTYKMTHLYYNWTGTISIPAPAQYAHRLAQLVGQHLHKDVSISLCDKLYFL